MVDLFAEAPAGRESPREGSLLVGVALAALLAAGALPIALGLGLLALARAVGFAAGAAAALLLLAGVSLLLALGPTQAVSGYAAVAPLWKIEAALAERGVLGALGAALPLALLGAGATAVVAAVWLAGGRVFWERADARPGLAQRLRARRQRRRLFRGQWHESDRLPLGLGADGDVVSLAPAELGQHALVVGATGSGKTTSVLRLLAGLLAGPAGIVVVDLKADPALAAGLQELAQAQGRTFERWTLDGPARWNPLARGDATELMNKLVALEQWTEPHYKRAAQRYFHALLSLLLACGREPDLRSLLPLLEPEALLAFADREAGDALTEEERDSLQRHVAGLDRSSASAVRGLANRLALLAETRPGRYLEGGPGTLDLGRTFAEGRVTLFSLDAQKYGETAGQLGALVAQDLRAVASERLAAARAGAPAPSYAVFDEFSAMRTDHLLHLFARGRGAGVGVILATQELADLTRVDPGFADQVLGNTNVKLVHRQDVPESADRLAAIAGTRTVFEETFQTEHAPIRSVGGRRVRGWGGQTTGRGTIREVEQYVVHPNVLKQLPQGTAVLIRKHPKPQAEVVHVLPLAMGPGTARAPSRRAA